MKYLVALLFVCVPGVLQAQRNAFAEFYGGVYLDDGSHAGPAFGARAGLGLAPTLRLVADVAFSDVNDVGRSGTNTSYFEFGRDQWLLTAGLEVDVVRARAAVFVDAQAGLMSSKPELESTVGSPQLPAFESSTQFIVAPGVGVQLPVGRSIMLRAGARDLIIPEEPIVHNLLFSVGLRFAL